MTSTPETSTRDISTVGVIGLGTMGAGIAEVFARNGIAVIGAELNDEGVERGRQHLVNSTARALGRGKISEEEQTEILGRISFTTDLAGLKDAEFVVEAVVENLAVKREISLGSMASSIPRRSWRPTPPRSVSPRSPPPIRGPVG